MCDCKEFKIILAEGEVFLEYSERCQNYFDYYDSLEEVEYPKYEACCNCGHVLTQGCNCEYSKNPHCWSCSAIYSHPSNTIHVICPHCYELHEDLMLGDCDSEDKPDILDEAPSKPQPKIIVIPVPKKEPKITDFFKKK